MGKKTSFGWLACALFGSGLMSGCDLLEFAKNPSITLTLPSRSYSFSTSDPRWKQPPPNYNQKITCQVVSDCCKIPGGGAIAECSQFPLACEGNVCAMRIALDVPQPIDLKKDAPEFAEVGGRVVKDVLLRELHYTVDNQIGTDLPPVDVFVAPATVMSAKNNPDAKLLVTLPKTVAGKKSEETITLTSEAQQAFSDMALNLEKPFNLIAGTDVLVFSGTTVPPNAKVDITVSGKVTVKF
jgi:hypothetical protein